MRCPLNETMNNGRRPEPINNGFAPHKPGQKKEPPHSPPRPTLQTHADPHAHRVAGQTKQIPPKRQSDLPKTMGAPEAEGTIVKIAVNRNGARSANSFVNPAA